MTSLRSRSSFLFTSALLMLAVAATAVALTAESPAAADHTGDGIWLVTIPDNAAGWALLDGTGQWVDPACRTEIESEGGFFQVVEWATIADTTDPAEWRSCDDIKHIYFGPEEDLVAPATSLSSPLPGATVGELVVQGSASDAVGVSWLQIMIRNSDSSYIRHGRAALTQPGGTTTDFEYRSNLIPDGTYGLYHRAWDEAGNPSRWQRQDVTIESSDTNGPSTVLSSPAANATVDELVVQGSASDESGVSWLQIMIRSSDSSYIRHGRAALSQPSGTTTDFEYRSNLIPDGTYGLYHRAWDEAGNPSRWQRQDITIDTGAGQTDPVAHQAMLMSNPTRNTLFDSNPYRDVPASQISVSDLTVDGDLYDDELLDTTNSGYFRVKCEVSHFAYDDPIVYPNEAGRAHLHMFFGNTDANAFSTFDSLLNSGTGTCNGEDLNRTAYWVPAMLDNSGNALIPYEIMVYYKNDNFRLNGANELVSPFPDNLRMIAGDGGSRTPQTTPSGDPGSQPVISFSCGPAYNANDLRQPLIPDCYGTGNGPYGNDGRALEMQIAFPQCYDPASGTYLSDQTHTSYSEGGYYGTRCPDSHSMDLSSVMYRIFFSPDEYGGALIDLHLSSDVKTDTILPGGTTAHADWFGAWHPDAMDLWVDNCNNTQADCEIGLLGRDPLVSMVPRQEGFYPEGYRAPAQELIALCPGRTFDPGAPLRSVAMCRIS